MLICPLNSKINELTVSLGNYYDAMQVYLLSEGKYPSKEDALKIRNRFKNTPFYSSIAHYEDNLSIYRNFTTDGVVQGLDKAELAEVEKIFKNRGFKITVPLHTVQGSRRIKDTESWMFIVDTPMYQAAEVSREEFLQNETLIAEEKAEDKIAFNKTEYQFKAVNIITANLPKITSLFSKLKNTEEFWNKIQKDFQIPKDQIELLKESEGNSIEEKLASFAANYSYTVEINVATESTKGSEGYYAYEMGNDISIEEINGKFQIRKKSGKLLNEKFDTKEQALNSWVELTDEDSKPTQHYSNLTVPGGTNYTENEIATPAITPSIKGHAEFSTDKGIGWFRSDEQTQTNTYKKEYRKGDVFSLPDQFTTVNGITVSKLENNTWISETDSGNPSGYLTDEEALSLYEKEFKATGTPTKTRRILEVQSDLFQKGRDKENLITNLELNSINEDFDFVRENEEGYENSVTKKSFDKEKELSNTSQNQFLQLLNKDNNWVTFFIKSVIQDSAKKGYEKVLFPTGDTASKVEGHSTLEEFKKQKEGRIKELEQLKANPTSFEEIQKQGKALEDISPFGLIGTQQEVYNASKSIEAYNKFIVSRNIKFDSEISQLKQELERVEKEGFGALKPIYNFYENAVTNVLKKQYGKENVKQVTDEYGNTWNEITLDKVRDTAPIAFNKNSTENKQAKAVVVKMLDKLAKRFNVPYEIITAAKAKKLYDNYGGEKAFYYKGKVYLLEDGITLENALHEFSHPFIRAIAQKNVDLFTNIVEEILSTPEGRAIYNQVKELYPEHVVDGELNYAGFEEVAVRALTAEAEKQYTTPEFESAVQRLLKAIKNLLRGLFSTNAVDTIDANTSLKELAGILLGDKAYNLDLQDGAIAFNKSIKYEIYNGLPFTEESLARMSDGEKRITVRTKVHPTGIYEYNGQRFKILNLGQKNIKDFKTPERVKRKFREEYKKGMFKHIDNFFDGKTNLFVYQIEKIDNSIVNEYVKEEPLDEDLVFTNATTNATVKAIKDWLVSKKDSALKHKSDTGLLSKLKKVEDIEEQLKQLSLAEIMGSIVNDVYSALADPNNPNSYLLQFKKIIQEVASAETREDAEKVVEKIGAYKEYVAGLKIIDDLLNYQLAEENPNEGSTLAKLNGIKNALFELDKKIKDTAPYVLAIANKGSINEELRKNIEAYWPIIKKLESDIRELEAKGEKIKAAALKSKKEDLERKLGFPLLGDLTQIYLEGGNDINFFERMVKTVANTTDAAIGLFYKRYKEEIDKGRKKINELTKATYYKYKQFTEGKSIDNFEQLYEKMTENVDILRFNEDSGQYETFTEKWFISDFDQNAYNLKRKQAYDLATLEEKKARDAAANGDNEGYKEGMATARRIRANFRRNNTIAQDKLESRDKVIEILLQKEKLFDNSAEGKSQFYAWVTNHLYNEELYIEYVSQEDPTKIAEYGKRLLDSYIQNKGTKVSGMFLVPDKTKFPNAKYNALTTEDRKYYDHLLSVYKESQKLLPEFERPGLRVPSVEKDIKDILIEQKDVKKSAVAAWERNFKNHIEDASKGIVYKGQTKRIPVYFNQSMAADTVSMNLTDTVMKFAEMAEQFKINSSLESLALLTKETIAERIVEKKTSTGKKILSALHKKMYGEEVVEPIKFAETEAYKMFESWLDSNFYNERRYAANLGTVRLDKVVDTMMAANALSVLGADGLKALSNRLTAGVNIAIESLGNKYFTAKTLVKGKAKVGQLMYATTGEENLLMDTLRGVKTTHFGQMLDIFQAIQGENDAVEEIGGSMVKRNASTSLLMGGLSAGEFIAQANMFAAIAYDIKIKTKSGEEISLLDAYIKEADGIVRLRKDVEFTLEDEQLLRNKINAINKELHGVYNKIDEVEAKKNWVGRALIQFRNFLVPNVERRFQELHVNFEMNDIVEGYYKTLYRKMVTERNFKIWQIYNDPSLTENERNNLKKAVVELTSYFVLAAIVSILGSMGDDDDELKDNYAYNVALYSALRLKGEIGFFIPGINLKEGYRIIKSPSAINTLLERSVKFGGQLFTDPFGEYERNSGPWEKGDSKLKAKFLKLFFGYNGSNLDPSIAVENFKGLSN